jgi:hypothetical protein
MEGMELHMDGEWRNEVRNGQQPTESVTIMYTWNDGNGKEIGVEMGRVDRSRPLSK